MLRVLYRFLNSTVQPGLNVYTGVPAVDCLLRIFYPGNKYHHSRLPANSDVTVSPATIVADGTDATTVSYVAKDANGNPVTGLAGTILAVTGVTGTTFSGFTESATPGTWTGTLTGTQAGTAQLMPQVN